MCLAIRNEQTVATDKKLHQNFYRRNILFFLNIPMSVDQLDWPSHRNRNSNETKKQLFRQWFSHKIRNNCTIKTLHNDYGAHRLATMVSTAHHGRDEARILNCCLASPRLVEQWRFWYASEPNVSITNFSLVRYFFDFFFFRSLFSNCRFKQQMILLALHNGKKSCWK